jgi:hypothetical protein
MPPSKRINRVREIHLKIIKRAKGIHIILNLREKV